MDIHLYIHDAGLNPVLKQILDALSRQEIKMAALDDKIAELTTEVANNTVVEHSALTLIQGFAAQLAAAVAGAQAAGATPEQLQGLTDLHAQLATNDAALAAAVAANTTTPTPLAGGTGIPLVP